MENEKQQKSFWKRCLAFTEHPLFNLGFLAWGLFMATVWATFNDDVYLIAKAGEIVALALGRLLIQRHLREFFWGMLVTSAALPIALYTSSPIFWGRMVPLFSEDFFQLILVGTLCGLPLLVIGLWGLRKTRNGKAEPEKPDPKWFRALNHLFKWAMTVMVFSFHLANPPLIIAGILVFLFGIISLAVVRLRLTLRHVGLFLMLVGGGTVVISILLIPLGIAHVSPAEAAMAAVPGAVLAGLGSLLFLGKSSRSGTGE